MAMGIDLIWLDDSGDRLPEWALGEVRHAAPNPVSVARAVAEPASGNPFVLFWDASLGLPDPSRLAAAIEVGGDVWHAGLMLGMTGQPPFLDYVNPSWRLNPDPSTVLVATNVTTSWRMSLRACLARWEVIRTLGGPLAAFETLDAAALELGHRWINAGALMRHVPSLVPANAPLPQPQPIPLVDEFRFVRARFPSRWARWALWRAWRSGEDSGDLRDAYRRSDDVEAQQPVGRLHSLELPELDVSRAPTVSVLIPTLDRYPYLFEVLDQLRNQTVAPLEIIVVDQTNLAERDWSWPEQFTDLPLQVIWRDEAGQCSSRNAGLEAARGETVLFLDDDNQIGPDLIERHLAFLQRHAVDGSIGVSEEAGAGALPPEFQLIRDSDVFSTGNSLLFREALAGSGLFDMAYERGSRADGDLGMRLYLAGKLLVLNPSASALHLHAPRGGLRQHGARAVTLASSTQSLTTRHLLAPTEGYLLSRYFTARQVDEAVMIRTFATLSSRQRGLRRWARLATMVALLPDTHRRNRRSLAEGRRMLAQHPTIPMLNSPLLQEN
jgi:hypothetical protein